MTQAPFASKAPERLPAALWSVIFILLPAPAVFADVWWGWLVAIPCLAMAGVLLLSLSFPTLFLYGVRRHAGGFEFRTVLRRPKSIEYSAIAQIDAVVRRDGDMGFAFVDLIIRTPQHSVRIPEGLLSEAGLIAELKNLPGFNAEAFAMAESYEPTGLSELFPKRFRVFPTA